MVGTPLWVVGHGVVLGAADTEGVEGGVMLSAFGVFWIGEGFGVDWPGKDIAIIVFAALFFVVALGTVALTRRVGREALQ